MRRPQLQPQLPLGRYSTLLHWPCPNKTSSYPEKAGETRARSSLSQRANPTHSPLCLLLSPSHFSPICLCLSFVRIARASQGLGTSQHWAVPRTQQTLPGLIRLAWHDAFFSLLALAPSVPLPLRLSFLFNKCQEKVFFSTFSPVPWPLPLSFSVLVVEFETLLRQGVGDCMGVRSSSRHMPAKARGKGPGKGNGSGSGSGCDSSYSSSTGNTFEEGHIAGAAAVTKSQAEKEEEKVDEA